MRLILLRHAIAEEFHPEHPESDFARRLTPEGRGKLRRVLDCFRRLEPPQSIYTSPLVRARQTARMAGRRLDLPVHLCGQLQPGGRAFEWLGSAPEENLMVVGHEPDLSWLAAQFLGLPRPAFRLKKSGMMGLQGEPGRGQLLWLITPRWLV